MPKPYDVTKQPSAAAAPPAADAKGGGGGGGGGGGASNFAPLTVGDDDVAQLRTLFPTLSFLCPSEMR